jgi:hypothetical protein
MKFCRNLFLRAFIYSSSLHFIVEHYNKIILLKPSK